MPKFCVDCRWFSGKHLPECLNLEVGRKITPDDNRDYLVTGKYYSPFARTARSHKLLCGPEARFFEPQKLKLGFISHFLSKIRGEHVEP